jgi:response regulator RpfG family c-di-GMP phosphodiesterase
MTNDLATAPLPEAAVDSMPDSAPGSAQEPTPWTVLCVDDEANIVSALRRLFRGSGYRVFTALSGAEALELMAREHVDLVISDMRMPFMDGAQLLEQVRSRWPATTRILLTGYADVASSVAAINRGEVYRYITKPWNDGEILMNVGQAFERQALERERQRLQQLTERQNTELKDLNITLEARVAERTAELAQAAERIKRNYLTSIKVLSDLAGLRNPSLVGHARRVADISRRIGRKLGMSETQAMELFIAGLLHDIGHIGLPDTLLAKTLPKMSAAELTLYKKHTVMGEQALMPLDDMQAVVAMIRSHHERFDGKGSPDHLVGEAIPLGARILALADAYDDLQNGHVIASGLSAAEAATFVQCGRGNQFQPEVVDAFVQVLADMAPRPEAKPIPTHTDMLAPGMVLASELRSPEGVMLLAADQPLTADLINRIRQYEQRDGLTLVLSIKPAPAR